MGSIGLWNVVLVTFVVHVMAIAEARYFISSSVLTQILRAALLFGLFHFATQNSTLKNWPTRLSIFTALLVVPVVALSINSQFLYYLSRASIVSMTLIFFILYWSRDPLSESLNQRERLNNWLSRLVLLGLVLYFGFHSCDVILDHNRYSYRGWYNSIPVGNWELPLGIDGAQYIELAKNLKELFGQTLRTPGFPLVIRSLFSVTIFNVHVLIIFNIICLIATCLLLLFAGGRQSLKGWIPILLGVPLFQFFNAARLDGYMLVLTDPMNDLLICAHFLTLYLFREKGEVRYFHWSAIFLLAAILLRPNVLYYAILISLLVGTWVWRKKGSVDARKMAIIGVRVLVLPILALAAFNGVKNGMFGISSISTTVLYVGTLPAMRVLSGKSQDFIQAKEWINRDFYGWVENRVGVKRASELSVRELERFKSGFSRSTIFQNLKDFSRVIWAGVGRLIVTYPLDLLIFISALLCSIAVVQLRFFILWPVYSLMVYSLNGAYMEYRYTLQILLPCLMILALAFADSSKVKRILKCQNA